MIADRSPEWRLIVGVIENWMNDDWLTTDLLIEVWLTDWLDWLAEVLTTDWRETDNQTEDNNKTSAGSTAQNYNELHKVNENVDTWYM